MVQYGEIPDEIVKQKHWTAEELRSLGYEYYQRKKEVTMARELPGIEAPKVIITSQGDKLLAETGYIICYRPGDTVRPSLEDYDQWPVEPQIFSQTYKPWDEPDWTPSPAERHLMKFGCQPYFKSTGVWAKKLTQDTLLQSKEHVRPVLVRTGEYVAVGVEGEPYSMGERTFHNRYEIAPRRSLLTRLIDFFTGRQ